ncbi:MAG: GNAT family N-acyltransferase [Rhodospirillales bacterium]
MEPLTYNNFTVRLAASDADIEAAQRLRYRVFYEEMAATPTPEMRAHRRDFDAFDSVCDHLLVIDTDAGGGTSAVAGTYRLLRRSVAAAHGGFYTQQEYDLDGVLTYPGEIVEVGRSCVDAAYRSRGVMQLLWRGLAEYVRVYEIQLMFGCASFPGTEPDEMGAQLTYLHHFHLAPSALRPTALAHLHVPMERVPPGGLDTRAVLAELPPLIKGYLRVGGFVGDGAVVDHQFNTTDVCIIVKTDQLTEKYEKRYRVDRVTSAEPDSI